MKTHQKLGPGLISLAVLIAIATIAIVGCVDSTQDQQSQMTPTGNQQSEHPAAATTATTRITTEPAPLKTAQPTPATGSSDGVILLDPMSDRYDGQEYLITGTTSLPVGTDLVLQLRPDTGAPPTGYDKEVVGAAAGSTAWIIGGNGTSNRIVIEGSMTGQDPGKWVAVLGNRIDGGKLLGQTVMGRHIGYTYFNQKQDSASLSSVDSAGRSPKKGVKECIMTPVKEVTIPYVDGFRYYNITAFTPLSEENYSTPLRNKDPGITIGQAKDFAKKAFPQYSPDRVEMEFSDGSQSVRGWNFDLYKDNQKIIIGSLYADTGVLMSYFINSRGMAEQGKANPATTMDSARVTAENEIRERNGEIPLNLVNSRLQNGNYVFIYRRIIQGITCYSDGININIDSGTGKVSSYYKFWYTPENAVATQTVPAISRDEAIALVEREAKACYPDSADSFRIVSADLRWMDLYHPDEFTPKPGVIPLAWNVRFDDKTIQTNTFPNPEEGWVDAQNGTLLVLEYFHNR